MTLDKQTEFDLGDLDGGEKDWAVYIKGMIKTLKERDIVTGGLDLVIDTDIPFGAGLSSSAALEVAVGLAIASMAGKEITPLELALAGQEVEHRFAGVRSGIMDQLLPGVVHESTRCGAGAD
jgi:galactokinase